ncbi:uncharacterized protein LOC143029624 isoform X2 [Oratosquilla oratoria]
MAAPGVMEAQSAAKDAAFCTDSELKNYLLHGNLPAWVKPYGSVDETDGRRGPIPPDTSLLSASIKQNLQWPPVQIQDDQRKRKAPSTTVNEDSENSDTEEILPSNKRQRVTVSAMRKLFAKFTINDDEKQVNESAENVVNVNTNLQATQDDKSEVTSKESITQAKAEEPENVNNDDDDEKPLNLSFKASVQDDASSVKDKVTADNATETSSLTIEPYENEANDLTQNKTEDDENNSDKNKDKANVLNNKRNAEEKTENSDSDDDIPVPKVKKTRRLRRGLRLCANVSCYIEQVIYN